MASKTNMSTRNQGPRLGAASTRGKVARNPMKPQLAANIKNSQGIGGGIKQGKGGAKYVAKAKGKGASGIKQQYAFPGTNKVMGKKATKLNLPPTKAQPKSPKNNSIQSKNNFTLHNTVTAGDVSRMRKAHNMPVPKMSGGGFKNYIGA